MKISTLQKANGMSIADIYAEKYTNSLLELSAAMPPFMGDLQAFVTNALATQDKQ